MSEKLICDNCKIELEMKLEGNCISFLCPNCGDDPTTTYFSPEELDRTLYSIILEKGNKDSLENIKIVSKLANCNFIKAKKCFEKETVLITEKALKIHKLLDELKETKLSFRVEPDFPY